MSYFTDALSNFTTQIAYKDAILRLYDKGLSIDEIKEQCLYPVTSEIISNVIHDYEITKTKPKAEYVEDINEYGKRTFRKVII